MTPRAQRGYTIRAENHQRFSGSADTVGPKTVAARVAQQQGIMSTQLIQQYHAKVERIIRYGGSRNESALRKPFQDLLEQYAASRDLLLVFLSADDRLIRAASAEGLAVDNPNLHG